MTLELTREEIANRTGTATQEPQACALTGQSVQGRHSVGYTIEGTEIRYRVLSKVHHLWTDEARAKFEARAKAMAKPALKTEKPAKEEQ